MVEEDGGITAGAVEATPEGEPPKMDAVDGSKIFGAVSETEEVPRPKMSSADGWVGAIILKNDG